MIRSPNDCYPMLAHYVTCLHVFFEFFQVDDMNDKMTYAEYFARLTE